MILAVSKVRNNEMTIGEASVKYSVLKSTTGDRFKPIVTRQNITL